MGEGMLEAWSRKRPFTVFRKVLNSGTKPKLLLAAEGVRPLELCCNSGGIKAGGDPRGPFRLLLAGPQVPALLAPRPASSPHFYTVQPNAASRSSQVQRRGNRGLTPKVLRGQVRDGREAWQLRCPHWVGSTAHAARPPLGREEQSWD